MIEIINKIIIVASSWLFILLYRTLIIQIIDGTRKGPNVKYLFSDQSLYVSVARGSSLPRSPFLHDLGKDSHSTF